MCMMMQLTYPHVHTIYAEPGILGWQTSEQKEEVQDGATCMGFYTREGAALVPRLSTCLREGG